MLRQSSLGAASVLTLLVYLLFPIPCHAGDDWKPIDPAQLALKEPAIDKAADAEALFWEVRVADEATANFARATRSHYLRVKIFTERGRETQGKVDLVFGRQTKISDIEARTIRPDGSILTLAKADIHQRDIVKVGRRKVTAMSFALPGVEPGAIVEYRWKETYFDQLSSHTSLPLQRDIPVWLVKYSIKPFSDPDFPYPMLSQVFNAPPATWTAEERGFYGVRYEKMAAFREEPHIPPENQIRAWILIYYTEKKQQPAAKEFWRDYGRDMYALFRDDLKAHPTLAAAAQTAMEGASSDTEKLARLVHFCRTKVKNVSDDVSTSTRAEARESAKERSPRQTLEKGFGSSTHIDLLFGALAASAGFDVRAALTVSREEIFFDYQLLNTHFMRHWLIAVRVGETWRLYEPSSRYAAAGTVPWRNEGVQVLVTDAKEPFFIDSPISPSEKSVSKRTARLRLAGDGTLEGDVRIEYAGHTGYARKEEQDERPESERESLIRERVQARLPGAEVSNVVLENVTEPEAPLTVRYQVRVPGYAARTGKRLFLEPAFFQKGLPPRFPTEARRHPIHFDYPWAEQDDVSIELPEGFALDHADAPAPLHVPPVADYDVVLKVQNRRTLLLERKFQFGGPGVILFEPKHYPALKQYFDAVHASDAHTITLKEAEAAPAAGAK